MTQVVELAPWWVAVMIIFVAAYFLVNGYVRRVPALTLLAGLFFILAGYVLPASGEPATIDMVFYSLNVPISAVFLAVGSVTLFTGVLQMVAEGD